MKYRVCLLVSLFFMISLMFVSCEKPFDTNFESIKENLKAENAVASIFELVSANAEGSLKNSNNEFTCYTAVLTGTTEARILTITFPEAGCPDVYGVIHKGKIIATFIGRWFNVGSRVSIVAEDYSQNGETLSGVINAVYKENVIEDGNAYPIHEITTNGMELESADGETSTWNSNVTLKWLQGYFTQKSDDNIILSNTKTNGLNANGNSFEATGTDLLSQYSCKIFVSGTYELTKSDGGKSVIDFGNGECDNKINVTQNGVTIELSY